MKVIYNGKLLREEELHLDIHNRAFTYGDGIFETIIGNDSEIRFLQDHLDRLSRGLQALRMEVHGLLEPVPTAALICTLRKENNIAGLTRIRIMAWRKSGGLFSPTGREADWLITAIAATSANAPKTKVCFFDDVRLSFSSISPYKKISALPYIMAGIHKTESGADDVVLSDTEGHIAECLSTNIWWIRNNVLYTPSLETGCIEGIMRRQILKFLKEEQIPFHEGRYNREELLTADFAFTSNVTGITAIRAIEGRVFQSESAIFSTLQGHMQ